MARAVDAKVTSDAGRHYCDCSWQSAVRAGLNAVFIHLPVGIVGLGHHPEGAARSVNRMLATGYREPPNGTLLMEDGATA